MMCMTTDIAGVHPKACSLIGSLVICASRGGEEVDCDKKWKMMMLSLSLMHLFCPRLSHENHECTI